MVRTLGKAMQLMALLLLPVAMFLELSTEMRAFTRFSNLSVMLLFLIFGVALFGLGRVVEGYSR